jgi:hypothetical protein
MLACDLCRHEIKPDEKFYDLRGKQVCDKCIIICKEIINNPKLSLYDVVSLNEYKELKEQGKI